MKNRSNDNADYSSNSEYSSTGRANETGKLTSDEQLLQPKSLEELRTLVGGIAHDFNNILNVITGHVSLMDRWRSDPERFMKSYDAVKKATERGSDMARGLLKAAKQTEVATERVNIGDIIVDIVELLRECFPENVIFDLKIDPETPVIPANSRQIYQALLSLCINAREAMPEGGTISITSKRARPVEFRKLRKTRSGRFAQVSVSHTGSGVSKEILERILEPSLATVEGSSADCGLPAVQDIMKAHSGFIDIESGTGQSTSFSLYFPVADQGPKTWMAGNESPDPPKGDGEVILVIEDEEPLKDFLRAVLAEGGYKILLASNGLEGLQTYRDHMKEVSLVLLDMGLPEMSGTEVLTGLLMLNPYAKVISAGGYLDPNVEADSLEIGALAFLPKPYMAEELLTKVHRALRATTG